jgi:hypothetical protein
MDLPVTQASDIWYVEMGEEPVQVGFEEIVGLASSGKLKRQDRVRRGDLRWLEAGRVPGLAGHFLKEEAAIVTTGPVSLIETFRAGKRPAATSFSVIAKSVTVILLLSLSITYLIMYYRDRADKTDGSDLPEVQQLQVGYEKEKHLLEEQAAANQQMLDRLDSVPRSQLWIAETGRCYVPKYSDAVGRPQPGPALQKQAVIDRELDEDCVEKAREEARGRALTQENVLTERRDALQQGRADFQNSLRELEIDTKGERARLIAEKQKASSKDRFYPTFIPVLTVLTLIGICGVTFGRIREYKQLHG